MDASSPNAGLASDHNPVLSPTVLVVGQGTAAGICQAREGLADQGQWTRVATTEEAIAHWQAHSPDLALVALGRAESDGLAFLTALASLEDIRPLPVVMWVAPGQERLALQGMKLGAADYFLADQAIPETLAEAAAPERSGSDLGPMTIEVAVPLWDCLQQVFHQVQAQRWRQRQATLAMHQAQQQYQNLVENSPDIIERFDLNLRHLYVSPALTEITGIPSAAFLGKSCREMALPDQMVTRWEAAATRLMATGERQMIEFSTSTPLVLRHFEMVLAPEWDDQHRLSSILCISRDITDHVAARQAQAQRFAEAEIARIAATTAQSLLASVFERISDGIVALDAHDRVVYINQQATQILNRAASDLLGQNLWVAFPEAPDQPFYADVKRAIQQQRPLYQEHFYLPYQRWFENRIYPSADGTTIYFTDITDRKQAETERLRSEQLRIDLNLLEQTLDSILAGYWDIDFASGAAYLSPGLKRMFGYTDEELPNRPDTWQRLIFAEDLPIALRCRERHISSRGQEPYYTEVRYHHKDGSTVWVICAGRVIDWDEAGNPLYMVGCHVDITPLKDTEAKLKKSEAHLQEAQRIGKVGSWNFELATEKITWSDQLYQIYGLTVGDVIPDFEALQAHFHPEDRNRHRQTVEAILATHQPYDQVFRILRPDGTLRYTQVRGEAVLNAAGVLTHLMGITQDVTERKQAEAQLEASNQELEAFAYSVSHDLRAPLRAIDGFSRALLEDYGDQLNEEGQDYFNRIRHNVKRMGTLIDDLLHLSRVSRAAMNYQPVNLSALVAAQVQEFQSAEPARFVTAAITANLTVLADPVLMQVLIANLVENAWKFTSHHPTASLEFGQRIEVGEPIYYLRDDGAGFDMAFANQLFGVFQRLHNTDEFPGTGIGLATVQRIIHRHGGRVWAEGSIEQGATIYFTVPPPSPLQESYR